MDRPEPELPTDQLPSAQPGGGWGYRAELLWARARRAYLRRFRPTHIERMALRRHGTDQGAPHAILDPRDLKYCRMHCDCAWEPADDPFHWRRRIPLAPWGWIELQMVGWPLLLLGLLAWAVGPWYAALPPAIIGGWLVWFFRDPPRRIPGEPGLVVSPADGKVVEVTRIEHDPVLGMPAIKLGIFLSVFNVHVNRSPVACRVLSLRYVPGRFLNALNPASSAENEQLSIVLEATEAPQRRLVVRQIAGAIARRIVCDLKVGETIPRGHRFGMIKFGSRTELWLPALPELELCAHVGDRVRGGASVVARYGPRSRSGA